MFSATKYKSGVRVQSNSTLMIAFMGLLNTTLSANWFRLYMERLHFEYGLGKKKAIVWMGYYVWEDLE